MSGILAVLLINAVKATGLALPVAVAGRVVRRPSVVHALWAVVLLALLSPPPLEVAIVPDVERWLSAATASPAPPTPEPGSGDARASEIGGSASSTEQPPPRRLRPGS
jgi:hypothetical protein